MKKIAILQSNYIPWKGYFDIINMVDEFILYDDRQYTKNDWRNRNKIKTHSGLQWLTIPVRQKELTQTIKETTVVQDGWRKKHWKAINLAYSKAPFFLCYRDIFEDLYLSSKEAYLSIINYEFIIAISHILNIKTKISWSHEYHCLSEDRTTRLIELCQCAGATEYVTGPAARDYIDIALFTDRGIKIVWADYSGYPEYPQLFPPFDHAVTILDMIFNCGSEAKKYMKSFKEKT
jgi:hypothetical protein